MRLRERTALRRRFNFRCGYCGVTEESTGAELTVDHFHPLSRGGDDNRANWVYSCFACNILKSDNWAPDSPERILHPIDDNLSAHIGEAGDGTLVGLTATGRFHIEQLHLNRAPLVSSRLARRREAEREEELMALRHDQEELRQQLSTLQARIAELERRLRS